MARRKDSSSIIALEECFQAEDRAFLDELRRFTLPRALAPFVEKWKTDKRPWARRMIGEWLSEPLNDPGFESLVKQTFKQAEAERDDQVMGWFMVAFDRIVRRRRVKVYHYDYSTRQSHVYEKLRARQNQTPRGRYAPYACHPDQRLYTHKTRYYLRRRVWRYFRHLAYRDPVAYRAAIAAAFSCYEDADFEKGENIIDNWSLMHACYFESPAIRFGASLVYLNAGHSLAELAPAPFRPDIWKAPEALHTLLDLIGNARSSLVRQWAVELAQAEHEATLARADVADVMALLTHVDPRVQEFGASLFEGLSGLGTLSIDTWLDILETDNLSVQALLCAAMTKHVAPERLDKQQLIALTNKPATPVSRMGFDLLMKRHASSPFTTEELAELSEARCHVTAGEIATWALATIGIPQHYKVENVVRFFDSLIETARAAALAWLVEGVPGWNDAALWVRLIETPFPDVKDVLVDHLESRAGVRGMDPDELAPLWTAVVLGVHRGGRRKPKAVNQIVAAVQQKPDRAGRLLPVLAYAVRSIRGPERRAGLAALATLAESNPTLHADLSALIPELRLPRPLAEEPA